MARLAGKVAMITGATSPAGATVVRGFSNEGAAVVMADTSETAMREVTRNWKRDRIAYCETNVTRREDIERCARQAIQIFGRIDIMVVGEKEKEFAAEVLEKLVPQGLRVARIQEGSPGRRAPYSPKGLEYGVVVEAAVRMASEKASPSTPLLLIIDDASTRTEKKREGQTRRRRSRFCPFARSRYAAPVAAE